MVLKLICVVPGFLIVIVGLQYFIFNKNLLSVFIKEPNPKHLSRYDLLDSGFSEFFTFH